MAVQVLLVLRQRVRVVAKAKAREVAKAVAREAKEQGETYRKRREFQLLLLEKVLHHLPLFQASLMTLMCHPAS